MKLFNINVLCCNSSSFSCYTTSCSFLMDFWNYTKFPSKLPDEAETVATSSGEFIKIAVRGMMWREENEHYQQITKKFIFNPPMVVGMECDDVEYKRVAWLQLRVCLTFWKASKWKTLSSIATQTLAQIFCWKTVSLRDFLPLVYI